MWDDRLRIEMPIKVIVIARLNSFTPHYDINMAATYCLDADCKSDDMCSGCARTADAREAYDKVDMEMNILLYKSRMTDNPVQYFLYTEEWNTLQRAREVLGRRWHCAIKYHQINRGRGLPENHWLGFNVEEDEIVPRQPEDIVIARIPDTPEPVYDNSDVETVCPTPVSSPNLMENTVE